MVSRGGIISWKREGVANLLHDNNAAVLRGYESGDELIHKKLHRKPPHRKVARARFPDRGIIKGG